MIAIDLIPAEARQSFEEFHASDLFAGVKAFQGIPEDQRFLAITKLVSLPRQFSCPYVYSAVNIQALQRSPMRSASWMDTGFSMCACAIDDFLSSEWMRMVRLPRDEAGWRRILGDRLSLYILDETNKDDMGRIRASYRALREKAAKALTPMPEPEQPMFDADGPIQAQGFSVNYRLRFGVDDVFFGKSSDSVGLQIADVCNWVMWRKLDQGIEDNWYRILMAGRVICAKPEPEWSQLKHYLRAHDE